MAFTSQPEANKGETGYSWLFFLDQRRTSIVRLVFTLLGIFLGIVFSTWYTRHGNDASPDSLVGYAYAIPGTIFLLLAAVLYSLRRRVRKKGVVGQLNASLDWHICLAMLGMVFVFLHAFGNFNPRSGTYALYGIVALTISGFVGRILDRLMPRLIAGEVHKALTARGDDRIESISQKVQSIVVHNTQELRSFHPRNDPPSTKTSSSLAIECHPERSEGSTPLANGFPFAYKEQSLYTPWDLAYISLEVTPQELSREAGQYRFIPDKQSKLTRPGALMPGTQEQMAELHNVERAMRREQFYRYVIHYWRKFHVALAFLTLGLVGWHIVYALQLLLPTLH